MWYRVALNEEPARTDELGRSADSASDATPNGPPPGVA